MTISEKDLILIEQIRKLRKLTPVILALAWAGGVALCAYRVSVIMDVVGPYGIESISGLVEEVSSIDAARGEPSRLQEFLLGQAESMGMTFLCLVGVTVWLGANLPQMRLVERLADAIEHRELSAESKRIE